MTVWAVHGVLDAGLDRSGHVDRIFLDRETLEGFLGGRSFVPLEEALEEGGDAITVDDGIVAAAEAARTILAAGWPVTLFVNPGDALAGRPLDLKVLDVALDRRPGGAIELDGKTFDLSVDSERRGYRLRVKRRMADLPSMEARLDEALRQAEALGTPDPELPDRVRTLTPDELSALRDEGVGLGNHGWNHVDHRALSREASAEQVARGRAWLESELGQRCDAFSVPFGKMHPPRGVGSVACRHWLLNTSLVSSGPLAGGRKDGGPRLHNRPDLHPGRLPPPAEPAS